MKCQNCNAKISDDAKFCLSCGAPVGAPTPAAGGTTCANCGAAVAPGAAFCMNCGTAAAAAPPAATVQPACKNCGAVLSEGYLFCKKCGTPVAPVEQAAAPFVVAAEQIISEVAPVVPAEQIIADAAVEVAPVVNDAAVAEAPPAAPTVDEIMAEIAPVVPAEQIIADAAAEVAPVVSDAAVAANSAPYFEDPIPAAAAPTGDETIRANYVPAPQTYAEPPSTVCPTCGAAVKEGRKFCGSCGTPIAAAAPATPYPAAPAPAAYIPPDTVPIAPYPQDTASNASYAPPPYVAPPMPPAKEKKKKKKGGLIAILIVAVIVLAGGGYFTVNSIQRRNKYQDAVQKFNSRDYAAALVLFDELGEYEDSQNFLVQCQQNIDYDKAMKLFNEENYPEAMKLFQQLGTFKDSAAKYQECSQIAEYNTAMDLFNSGEFYHARLAFLALEDFRDSAALAESCIQTPPKTGVLYHNPNYESSKSTFAIENDNSYRLYKVYNYENNDLVCTLFLRPNEYVSVNFPPGYYRINEAIGTQWFGEKDMFGEDAYYGAMEFDGNGTKYYEFKLDTTSTLRFDGSGETPANSDELPKEDF